MINFLQSVGALLVAFVSLGLLQGGFQYVICQIAFISRFGPQYEKHTWPSLVVKLSVQFVTAIAPGWLSSSAAPSRPFLHATIFATCLFILNVQPPFIMTISSTIPMWYWRADAVLTSSGIIIGAIVYVRHHKDAA